LQGAGSIVIQQLLAECKMVEVERLFCEEKVDQIEKTYRKENYRNVTWFVIGLIFLPLFPISIIPVIFIFGIEWDFRKKGWKYFTLGLLTSIIIFVLLICLSFVILITNPGSSEGT
jgi:hypothetical protein